MGADERVRIHKVSLLDRRSRSTIKILMNRCTSRHARSVISFGQRRSGGSWWESLLGDWEVEAPADQSLIEIGTHAVT